MKIDVKASKAEWDVFLLSDSPKFQCTQDALRDLTRHTVSNHMENELDRTRLFDFLQFIVTIGATRYLESRTADKSYTFPAYFTWYLAETINSFDSKLREPTSESIRGLWHDWNSLTA